MDNFTAIFPSAAQLDAQNAILARIANKMGAYEEPMTWAAIQAAVRAGTIRNFLQVGDQVTVKVDGVDTAWDVVGIDEDIPAKPELTHCLTLQSHDLLARSDINRAMMLFRVTAEACAHFGWPTTGDSAGMPAGTYHITLDHGQYPDGGTAQDGTYQFTTTEIVPIGGGFRHTEIGKAKSNSADYTKATILAGTFATYGPDSVAIEENLTTTEGDGGTDLGTTTAYDPQYKVGDYINFAVAAAYGWNRWRDSRVRQWLNSADEIWTYSPYKIWDGIAAGAREPVSGFCYRLDDDLRAVMEKTRRRVLICGKVFGDGSTDDQYDVVEDLVALPTRSDIFGAATPKEGRR